MARIKTDAPSPPAMSREEAKTALVNKVNGLQGLKATQFAAEQDLVPVMLEYDITELLEELVAENRILEIEYILPEMNYRLKSFYLPAGTAARLKGGGQEIVKSYRIENEWE